MKHLNLRRLFFRAAPLSVLVRRADERSEQRMRFKWLRLELGMELTSDEVRMVGQLHHLDVRAVWCGA